MSASHPDPQNDAPVHPNSGSAASEHHPAHHFVGSAEHIAARLNNSTQLLNELYDWRALGLTGVDANYRPPQSAYDKYRTELNELVPAQQAKLDSGKKALKALRKQLTLALEDARGDARKTQLEKELEKFEADRGKTIAELQLELARPIAVVVLEFKARLGLNLSSAEKISVAQLEKTQLAPEVEKIKQAIVAELTKAGWAANRVASHLNTLNDKFTSWIATGVEEEEIKARALAELQALKERYLGAWGRLKKFAWDNTLGRIGPIQKGVDWAENLEEKARQEKTAEKFGLEPDALDALDAAATRYLKDGPTKLITYLLQNFEAVPALELLTQENFEELEGSRPDPAAARLKEYLTSQGIRDFNRFALALPTKRELERVVKVRELALDSDPSGYPELLALIASWLAERKQASVIKAEENKREPYQRDPKRIETAVETTAQAAQAIKSWLSTHRVDDYARNETLDRTALGHFALNLLGEKPRPPQPSDTEKPRALEPEITKHLDVIASCFKRGDPAAKLELTEYLLAHYSPSLDETWWLYLTRENFGSHSDKEAQLIRDYLTQRRQIADEQLSLVAQNFLPTVDDWKMMTSLRALAGDNPSPGERDALNLFISYRATGHADFRRELAETLADQHANLAPEFFTRLFHSLNLSIPEYLQITRRGTMVSAVPKEITPDKVLTAGTIFFDGRDQELKIGGPIGGAELFLPVLEGWEQGLAKAIDPASNDLLLCLPRARVAGFRPRTSSNEHDFEIILRAETGTQIARPALMLVRDLNRQAELEKKYYAFLGEPVPAASRARTAVRERAPEGISALARHQIIDKYISASNPNLKDPSKPNLHEFLRAKAEKLQEEKVLNQYDIWINHLQQEYGLGGLMEIKDEAERLAAWKQILAHCAREAKGESGERQIQLAGLKAGHRLAPFNSQIMEIDTPAGKRFAGVARVVQAGGEWLTLPVQDNRVIYRLDGYDILDFDPDAGTPPDDITGAARLADNSPQRAGFVIKRVEHGHVAEYPEFALIENDRITDYSLLEQNTDGKWSGLIVFADGSNRWIRNNQPDIFNPFNDYVAPGEEAYVANMRAIAKELLPHPTLADQDYLEAIELIEFEYNLNSLQFIANKEARVAAFKEILRWFFDNDPVNKPLGGRESAPPVIILGGQADAMDVTPIALSIVPGARLATPGETAPTVFAMPAAREVPPAEAEFRVAAQPSGKALEGFVPDEEIPTATARPAGTALEGFTTKDEDRDEDYDIDVEVPPEKVKDLMIIEESAIANPNIQIARGLLADLASGAIISDPKLTAYLIPRLQAATPTDLPELRQALWAKVTGEEMGAEQLTISNVLLREFIAAAVKTNQLAALPNILKLSIDLPGAADSLRQNLLFLQLQLLKADLKNKLPTEVRAQLAALVETLPPEFLLDKQMIVALLQPPGSPSALPPKITAPLTPATAASEDITEFDINRPETFIDHEEWIAEPPSAAKPETKAALIAPAETVATISADAQLKFKFLMATINNHPGRDALLKQLDLKRLSALLPKPEKLAKFNHAEFEKALAAFADKVVAAGYADQLISLEDQAPAPIQRALIDRARLSWENKSGAFDRASEMFKYLQTRLSELNESVESLEEKLRANFARHNQESQRAIFRAAMADYRQIEQGVDALPSKKIFERAFLADRQALTATLRALKETPTDEAETIADRQESFRAWVAINRTNLEGAKQLEGLFSAYRRGQKEFDAYQRASAAALTRELFAEAKAADLPSWSYLTARLKDLRLGLDTFLGNLGRDTVHRRGGDKILLPLEPEHAAAPEPATETDPIPPRPWTDAELADLEFWRQQAEHDNERLWQSLLRQSERRQKFIKKLTPKPAPGAHDWQPPKIEDILSEKQRAALQKITSQAAQREQPLVKETAAAIAAAEHTAELSMARQPLGQILTSRLDTLLNWFNESGQTPEKFQAKILNDLQQARPRVVAVNSDLFEIGPVALGVRQGSAAIKYLRLRLGPAFLRFVAMLPNWKNYQTTEGALDSVKRELPTQRLLREFRANEIKTFADWEKALGRIRDPWFKELALEEALPKLIHSDSALALKLLDKIKDASIQRAVAERLMLMAAPRDARLAMKLMSYTDNEPKKLTAAGLILKSRVESRQLLIEKQKLLDEIRAFPITSEVSDVEIERLLENLRPTFTIGRGGQAKTYRLHETLNFAGGLNFTVGEKVIYQGAAYQVIGRSLDSDAAKQGVVLQSLDSIPGTERKKLAALMYKSTLELAKQNNKF